MQSDGRRARHGWRSVGRRCRQQPYLEIRSAAGCEPHGNPHRHLDGRHSHADRNRPDRNRHRNFDLYRFIDASRTPTAYCHGHCDCDARTATQTATPTATPSPLPINLIHPQTVSFGTGTTVGKTSKAKKVRSRTRAARSSHLSAIIQMETVAPPFAVKSQCQKILAPGKRCKFSVTSRRRHYAAGRDADDFRQRGRVAADRHVNRHRQASKVTFQSASVPIPALPALSTRRLSTGFFER